MNFSEALFDFAATEADTEPYHYGSYQIFQANKES